MKLRRRRAGSRWRRRQAFANVRSRSGPDLAGAGDRCRHRRAPLMACDRGSPAIVGPFARPPADRRRARRRSSGSTRRPATSRARSAGACRKKMAPCHAGRRLASFAWRFNRRYEAVPADRTGCPGVFPRLTEGYGMTRRRRSTAGFKARVALEERPDDPGECVPAQGPSEPGQHMEASGNGWAGRSILEWRRACPPGPCDRGSRSARQDRRADGGTGFLAKGLWPKG